MAMGTRETDQPPLWIATSDLPTSPGHPFYARLTTLLDGHHFDRFVEGLCARFYAPVMGRPSLAPGRYFRLLLVGYFEGIDSERGMAWRATDSLAVRSFLRLAVDEAPPDHSTIARTRRLIDLETHRTVFTWVQQRLVEAGRLTGKTIAIDATTLEANAAMRSIVRRDTGESDQAFLAGLATASGIETPTREALARLDRKRKKKTSNTDWTNPHDPDAKVTKMKDGRTHLAHKAEHAVDMETGAIVAVTLQGADVGDTTTIIETAIAATEQVEDAQANVGDPQSLDEIVGDTGYHSNQTLVDLAAGGIRSYVSEPDRGRRDWSKAPEAQAPVYGNRRRMRGRRGRRLMRQRGERIERSFAHLYDTGGMRRTHLRGHTNILKRLLIHAGGFNLGLVMRHLIGIGTPRGLQGRVAAVLATLSVHMGVVRGRLTPISSSHRLIPAVRDRLASLTTFAVNSSAAITCTTGCYAIAFVCWFVMATALALVAPHFSQGVGGMLHMALLLWVGFSATTVSAPRMIDMQTSRLTASVLLGLALGAVGTVVSAHPMDDQNAAFVQSLDGPAIFPFLYLGAKHMVTGYDHLLFLVGVIFFLYKLKDVVLYVSLFTVGHSLTLMGGVLGDIGANAYAVDAIIGLSVAYKAFDNVGGFERLFGRRPDPKAAVLVFGLFHGFGLATKVQEFTLSETGLITNMLSFNVGVEVGQILALTMVLIGFTYWRRRTSFLRHAFATNVVLMVAGFVLAGNQMLGYIFYS